MLSASKVSLSMHEKSEWKSENSEEILVKTYRCYIWSKEKKLLLTYMHDILPKLRNGIHHSYMEIEPIKRVSF